MKLKFFSFSRIFISYIAIVLVGAGYCLCSQAEDPYNLAIKGDYAMPGFGGARAYDEGAYEEIIDPFGGSLKLVYRDLYLPGNGGLDISIFRTYNSLQSFYSPLVAERNSAEPPSTPLRGRSVIGLGWDMHMGRVWTHQNDVILASNTPSACKINNVSSRFNPVLELADGTRKQFVNDDSNNYSFTTNDFWKAKCLPTSQDRNRVGGLVVYSPEGMTYTFNQWGYPTSAIYGAYLVTKIEDRNGNWISISYLNTDSRDAKHVLIDEITSSDGRRVTFAYRNGNTTKAILDKISAHGQTVEYSYDTRTDSVNAFLEMVKRPDNSSWEYDYYTRSSDRNKFGWHSLKEVSNPYGLTTEYEYDGILFALSGTDVSWVITKKVTGGPGIEGGEWNYRYAPSSQSDKTTVMHDNGCIIYEHLGSRAIPIPHNHINDNLWKQGILISKEIRTGSSTRCNTGSTSLIQREELEWFGFKVSSQNEFRPYAGNGAVPNTYVVANDTYAPLLKKRIIRREDTDYIVEYSNFDSYGNAKTVVESQGSDSRTRNLTYTLPRSIWMPHLVKTESITGVSGIVNYDYDNKGNLTSEDRYGVKTQYSYHTDGNLKYVIDANNHRTDYSNYYRGIARKEERPEQVAILREVDAWGNITCEAIVSNTSSNCTTVNGIKTQYTYDSMNRLKSIVTPLTTDNNVSFSYNYSGDFKRTLTRGSLKRETTYNGMGDITKEVSSSGSTSITINYQYDELGRQVFKSDPNSRVGTRYAYDELDRLESITHTADNSSISYSYQRGNKVRIRDERNFVTTYEYLGYGSPEDAWLVSISAPEGVTTRITRFSSGLIDKVTQGSFTHNYGYNSRWQLTSETRPETGTITYGRDGIGNMTSRKVGNSETTQYTYDDLNRVKTINYPGDTEDVSFTYDVRGNVKSVTKSNLVWHYDYDLNNNLDKETLRISDESINWTVDYTYNGNDVISDVRYPSGQTIAFAPDGFGRPTRVGNYATGVTYHPSGQLHSYSLGNGKTVRITQNSRLFPDRLTVSGSVMDLDYGYDNAGNVESITDGINSLYNQRFGYDGLNRLESASGYWGSGSIVYDALGNIKTKNLGDQNLTFHYDMTSNRLESVTGSTAYSFGYDVYGNVNSDGKSSFAYDHASNLIEVTGIASAVYEYDGNNRRTLVKEGDVTTRIALYNRNGKLLYEQNPVSGNASSYFYLAGQLIARKDDCTDYDSVGDGLSDCAEGRRVNGKGE